MRSIWSVSWTRLTLLSMLAIATVRPCMMPTPCYAQNQQAAAEPLVEKVKTAIDKGVAFLRKEQKFDGKFWNWEHSSALVLPYSGGSTYLCTLALLTSGIKGDDPIIQRVLPYIRQDDTNKTYVTALQTMVLAEINENKDFDILQKNVQKLLNSRVYINGKLDGWSYSGDPAQHGDGSNTQYALLGLLAAKNAKVPIDPKVWKEISDFYVNSQTVLQPDQTMGVWNYYTHSAVHANQQTMTAAGICGLVIAGQALGDGQQKLDLQTGIAANCGKYEDNIPLKRGLRWLGSDLLANFSFRSAGHSFYNVYGIERVGRLTGQRFIGEHDWYREGCEALVGLNKANYPELGQKEDGSWQISRAGPIDGNPLWSTSFALLFLSKGRTPILISKFAYDGPNRDTEGWNNKHNDMRHLVEYSSREIFKKLPLAWQTYDPRKTQLGNKQTFDDELAGLLQSPILYISGHKRPVLTDKQVELLKRYLEEGGFILGHACCGSPEFTEGFRQLMKQIYPDSKLEPLRPDHPVWSAHQLVRPNFFNPPLEGIERGCKTIVMLSPAPLSGYWEEEIHDPGINPKAHERGAAAFRLGGNIIAYATGLEAPAPRLSKSKLVGTAEEKVIPRHQLQIAQLKHDGDYQPAPQAMKFLAANLRDKFQLDISLRKEDIAMSKDDIYDFRFLYMHGRKKFNTDDDDVKNVRAALETGGVLFADACCGKKEFDDAFREFARKLYPDEKLQRIPLEDFLFSEQLNGKKITTVRCRTEKADGTPIAEYENMAPFLEGIKRKDRWVVIYSKYDVGCALEKHRSSACKGHDFDSALQLGTAALLYSLKR